MYYLNRSESLLYFLLSDPSVQMDYRNPIVVLKGSQVVFLGNRNELTDLLTVYPDLCDELRSHLKTRINILDEAFCNPHVEGKKALREQRDGLISVLLQLPEAP